MLKRVARFAGAGAFLLAVTGCAASNDGATKQGEMDPAPPMGSLDTKSSVAEVRIDNFSFNPPTLKVAPGTKVTWVNHDDVPHTATSTTKVFASPALDTDESFTFVFKSPGEYPYYCAVHPHMTGKVIVQ